MVYRYGYLPEVQLVFFVDSALIIDSGNYKRKKTKKEEAGYEYARLPVDLTPIALPPFLSSFFVHVHTTQF